MRCSKGALGNLSQNKRMLLERGIVTEPNEDVSHISTPECSLVPQEAILLSVTRGSFKAGVGGLRRQ